MGRQDAVAGVVCPPDPVRARVVDLDHRMAVDIRGWGCGVGLGQDCGVLQQLGVEKLVRIVFDPLRRSVQAVVNRVVPDHEARGRSQVQIEHRNVGDISRQQVPVEHRVARSVLHVRKLEVLVLHQVGRGTVHRYSVPQNQPVPDSRHRPTRCRVGAGSQRDAAAGRRAGRQIVDVYQVGGRRLAGLHLGDYHRVLRYGL